MKAETSKTPAESMNDEGRDLRHTRKVSGFQSRRDFPADSVGIDALSPGCRGSDLPNCVI
eukprot:scaffold57088_cov26-Tisochrysis_lutea.AAC.3